MASPPISQTRLYEWLTGDEDSRVVMRDAGLCAAASAQRLDEVE